MRPLTIMGSVTSLGPFGRFVGLLLQAFGQGVPARTADGWEPPHKRWPGSSWSIPAPTCPWRPSVRLSEGQIPALQCGRASLFACRAAEGENSRDERQFAQGHTVNKILAAAKARVVDLDQVLCRHAGTS